ncbi:hypothetical protein LH398_00015 [Fusobacterium nucleatum]
MQEILATENKLAKIFQFSERKVREYFKAARYHLENIILFKQLNIC